MKLILVPKSSPDWGGEMKLGPTPYFNGQEVVAQNGNMTFIYAPDDIEAIDDFLTPPTAELLAWAQEHHFKAIMEDMRK